MMKEFYIDFSGWCKVEAETPEQAREEFYRLVCEEVPLPSSYYEVEGVEKKE